jgi:DNA-binding NarL/FixJ family response regulator
LLIGQRPMSAAPADDFAVSAERLRVAVIAPELLHRQALQQLVRHSPSLQLAASGAKPAQLDRQAAIDVLLADPGQPPSRQWIEAALATEQPLVVLVQHPTARLVDALARRGASVLPGHVTPAALSAALHCAAAGLVALAPAQLSMLSPGRSFAALPEPLTPREREVLSLLVDGLPNRGIAGALAISSHTAKFHVAQILAKLRAGSRAQAVAIALREGIVENTKSHGPP